MSLKTATQTQAKYAIATDDDRIANCAESFGAQLL